MRGFTLLETIVVLTLMIMILAITPPLYSHALAGSRLTSAARLLATALKEARNNAIQQQHETTLILDVVHQQFIFDRRQYPLKLPQPTKVTFLTADSEKINEAQAAIRFFPDGSSTGGKITLTSATAGYIVEINWLTGKIKVSP